MRSISRRKIWQSLALVLVFFAQSVFAQHYDEMRDEKGRIRPEYRAIYDLVEKMTPAERDRFLKESYQAFSGDNVLDPMPRVISAEEYDKVISRGVEQRAQALLAFLKDHYSGKKKYREFLSEEVVNRIIERSNEAGYKGQVAPELISFPYGPDIIRDAKGVWRVIEDNPGFIGGPGDLRLAQKFTMNNVPGLSSVVNARDPNDFYRRLTNSYKSRAESLGGVAVFLQSHYLSDAEDMRLSEIMKGYGIPTVSPESRLRLEIKPDGVFLYKRGEHAKPERQKVGYIVMNGEHSWFDPQNRAAFERLVIEEAREVVGNHRVSEVTRKKLELLLAQSRNEKNVDQMAEILRGREWSVVSSAFEDSRRTLGLLDAVKSKKVGINYSPGIDFIGDKEFYVHVEDIIRFYLKEEPILKNIETSKFADRNGQLNRAMLNDVLNNISEYVIKKVDGRGGNAVWVGPKMNASDLPKVQELIEKSPEFFIVQKYTPLSVLDGKIVDMRVIADVTPYSITVANTGWGRGLPMDGDGKVNLSREGREITILVTEKPKRSSGRGTGHGAAKICKDLFVQ